jgi:dienelactone hydrolase
MPDFDALPTASRTLEYRDGATVLEGSLHWPAAGSAAASILLIHGGAGLDQHAREQAERIAGLGYVVLACDMYGKAIAGSREGIMAALGEWRADRASLAARAVAGLTALADCPESAGPPRAAIGYCFGGMAALSMARAGVDLAGIISVHGTLSTPVPAFPGSIKAQVLACHGARDPHVPVADVTGFMAEMTAAEAQWRLNVYGSAMHGFTHRGAVAGATPGVAYDEAADRQSFDDIRRFLAGLA